MVLMSASISYRLQLTSGASTAGNVDRCLMHWAPLAGRVSVGSLEPTALFTPRLLAGIHGWNAAFRMQRRT